MSRLGLTALAAQHSARPYFGSAFDAVDLIRFDNAPAIWAITVFGGFAHLVRYCFRPAVLHYVIRVGGADANVGLRRGEPGQQLSRMFGFGVERVNKGKRQGVEEWT